MSGRWIVTAVCMATGLSQVGQAQWLETVEFTPFYGYRFGGRFEDAGTGERLEIDDSSAWGGILDIRWTDATQLEFYFSRQQTELRSRDGLFAGQKLFDLNVDYYHLGGTYVFLDNDPWQPFAVATVGATYMDPDVAGGRSLTRFSLGIGGGVRYFPIRNLGLYLAGRGIFTFMGGDTLFRSEGGQLTIRVDSDGLWQAELQAGLIFAF
jgi:opacity protein-like surface antigen